MPLLEAQCITKSFGELTAVESLSLTAEPGVMYGLLGPNGAGKTTTIRMIMQIIIPDSGEIKLFGDSGRNALNRVGYLPEERGLYRRMRVKEILVFFAALKNVPRRIAGPRIDEWLERFELNQASTMRINELSRGMQQKVQFISTILHDPELIILDEPFSGLDPINMGLLKDIMLEMKVRGKTIIFSTHLMDQVEKLCERIWMINNGRMVLDGQLSEIKRGFGERAVQIEYEGNGGFLADAGMVKDYNDYGNFAEVRLQDGADPQDFLNHAAGSVRLRKFELMEPSLAEIFIETTKSNRAGGEA